MYTRSIYYKGYLNVIKAMCLLTLAIHKGVSHAYKLWEDLQPHGQSFDRKFLLQHWIDEAFANFITKILFDP